MNVFARITTAINQSFTLIFESISRGIKLVYRKIKEAISIVSDLVKRFHEIVTTVIQLAINISSIVFILFVPFAFFFDPLDWSIYLEQNVKPAYVFWARMAFGAFFLLVAFLVVSSLLKSWKDSANSNNEDLEKNGEMDMVRAISGFLSWLAIAAIFSYFTVYRYQLLDIDIDQFRFPTWLDDYVK